jgi:hypothetical protein
LFDFGAKLSVGALDARVSVDIDPAEAKIGVAADVIEMALGVQDGEAIRGPSGGCVSVDGGGSGRIGAGIDDEGAFVTDEKAGVDGPGREISEAQDGEAAIREPQLFPIHRKRQEDIAGDAATGRISRVDE